MHLNRALSILVAVIVACLSLRALAQPDPIAIAPAADIQTHFQFWEDTSGHALIDQVAVLPEEHWSRVGNGSATFGITPSAYWLRFALRNQTSFNLNLIAELGYSQLDDVVFLPLCRWRPNQGTENR